MMALGLADAGMPFSLLHFFWASKRNEGKKQQVTFTIML
jgi:hypothetical protein